MNITDFQSTGHAAEWSEQAIMERVGRDFVPAPRNTDAIRRRRVLEAARLMADTLEGKVDPFLFRQAWQPTHEMYVHHLAEKYPGLFGAQSQALNRGMSLRETMSYSDYSALTVDIIDRMYYKFYSAMPITTLPLVKKHALRDFRAVARYETDGGVKPFSREPNDFPSLVPHGAGEPPTQRAVQQSALEVLGSTQRVTYQPQLYQGSMSINWRALVNDDLGIFQDLIQRLSISGNRTIASFITGLYANNSGSGYNTTLYNATFANIVNIANGANSNNPALSYQAILDARTVLSKQLDSDGQPIEFNGQLFLTVGPALETTAISLSKATQVNISVGGGTGGTLSTPNTGFPAQRLTTENWPMAGVQVIVDKYLPLINKTSSSATMWTLTYEPSVQARPSLELGQLAGYETAQIFQKVPNTMRVGGGVDPMLGDFWTMNQDYKGILVLGGTQIDGRSTVVSTGLGV